MKGLTQCHDSPSRKRSQGRTSFFSLDDAFPSRQGYNGASRGDDVSNTTHSTSS